VPGSHRASVTATVDARLNSLIGKNNAVISAWQRQEYAKLYGNSALDARINFQCKYPNEYNNGPLYMLQLQEVVNELQRLVSNYAARIYYYMRRPTQGWENQPIIYRGSSATTATTGAFKRPNDMVLSASAWVTASGTHSKSIPGSSIGGVKVPSITPETKDDAAWHYIWANNGVKERRIYARPRPGVNPHGWGEQPAMHFYVPYTAATQPASAEGPGSVQRGGTHTSGNTERFANSVMHGIKPRDFVGAARVRVEKTFYRDVILAIGKGIDKHQDTKMPSFPRE